MLMDRGGANHGASLKVVVKKQDGSEQRFETGKIESAIWSAARECGGTDKALAAALTRSVVEHLGQKLSGSTRIAATDIGDAVEKVLIESGHAKTAKRFILFRENSKHAQQDKSSLGVVDDIGLSYNTLYVLKRRYLKRNADGETIETPRGMIDRVARVAADVEKSERLRQTWRKRFSDLMVGFEFLPGTRTLANAGKKERGQLANCFVWPLEDDINQIFRILHESTLIKRDGGGCGYNYSNIRPRHDLVDGIPSLAAGPVKMIEMFDLMTGLFRQEGRYESGNMAVLNADHADIFNFINAKQEDGHLPRTNISVGITDGFMEAARHGEDWELKNPRTGAAENRVNARSILDLMAQLAWSTGDPGIVNLSAINRGTAMANPLLEKRGPIWATNPCGEVPLYPYESCNLGYVNFNQLVKEGVFDFDRLGKVMSDATRLMDNIVDASVFPVERVTEAVRSHRRIGIGCVGWADALISMNIPYDSEEAYRLAESVTKTMYESAFETSLELAREKGSFPLVSESIWAGGKAPPRNVALLTFPPGSGNSVICETSFGIEPLFALAYDQNVFGGMRFRVINQDLVRQLKQRGLFSDDLARRIIENNGSIQGLSDIPIDIHNVFKVAHDIDWRDHIKMQAAFQRWTDNAITKTINMPATATPEDIREAYFLAWESGCKGLTVYRDNTKNDQVFSFGGSSNEASMKRGSQCPECGHDLVYANRCYKCKRCGYARCEN